jgi:asparagine synthase (glutamine-hydrolysing)
MIIYNFKNDTLLEEKYFKHEKYLEVPTLDRVNIFRIKKRLYKLVDRAVKNSIKVPCKVGALLSGGIDSSVICALAQKSIPDLDLYSVVTENSSDLPHAINFAEMYPNTNHHIYHVNLHDLMNIIPEVIYHLETFDAALIRSALPMYYISSKVKDETGILLTGEGGDELFGGYDYLKDLPPQKLKKEFVNMLKIEHATGLQRVDRIPYAFTLEARAPWFDQSIIDFAFSIPINIKFHQLNNNITEKWIIRETFKEIIPESIYKRKKQKFSQGVGSQFLLRDYYNREISDEDFNSNKEIFPGIFVKNKEELYYWRVFNSIFQPTKDFISKIPRTEVWTY